jgi:chromosome segregation protein
VDQSRLQIARLKERRTQAEAEFGASHTQHTTSVQAFEHSDRARTEAILKAGEAQVQAVSAQGRMEGLAHDLDRTREMQAEVENRIAHLVSGIADTGEKRRQLAGELAACAQESQTLEAQRISREQAYKELREGARDLLTSLHEREKEVKEARRLADVAAGHHHDAEMAGSEARLEVSNLAERVRDAHGVDIGARTDLETVEAGQRGLLALEVEELRGRLDQMGTVNMLALEEYDEQNARLQFLDRQLADMAEARTTLLDTIQRINATARAQFEDTFRQVEANFSKLFEQLFEGGQAHVSLDLPDDPLESPISVTARPRGKKPVTILQLSGGERALTAIALLFSLYMVKPSPFCILDEIDAPLDDANIGRFLSMLQRFADNTQFIIITHNKMTMEAVDVLYGVTMQSPGISRVVSVRLNESLEPSEAAA